MRPFGRLGRTNLGIQVSGETDYLSLGLSAGIARGFAMRHTTLAGWVTSAHDTVRPIGGAPEPLTPMVAANEGEWRGIGPGRGKNVVDLMVGLTQVLDRATIARANYSVGLLAGYLNDPYKMLSLVRGTDQTGAGDPIDYLYERRPDDRLKQSLYGEIRRRIGPAVADASYRYYWDSWSVHSSAADLRLDHPLGKRTSVRPHYRYYRQRRADFYAHYLTASDPAPSHASADFRLGTFTASTFGLDVAHTFGTSPTLVRSGAAR